MVRQLQFAAAITFTALTLSATAAHAAPFWRTIIGGSPAIDIDEYSIHSVGLSNQQFVYRERSRKKTEIRQVIVNCETGAWISGIQPSRGSARLTKAACGG